jgi:hypothetical protein
MFIDEERLRATYQWEGEQLGGRRTPEVEKSGLTDLKLRRLPVFALPMIGDELVSLDKLAREFRVHQRTFAGGGTNRSAAGDVLVAVGVRSPHPPGDARGCTGVYAEGLPPLWRAEPGRCAASVSP